MSTYRIHSIDSAPEKSRPALQDLLSAFGIIPNLAATMAESPVLIDAFVSLFHKVHSGSLSEAQIQVVLLTNAVTNRSAWPVAFHSALALKEGIAPADVQAIREQRTPTDRRFAALSRVARALIEKRGHLDEQERALLREAGFASEILLEILTLSAASTMTNFAANITEPVLEAPFQVHAWRE